LASSLPSPVLIAKHRWMPCRRPRAWRMPPFDRARGPSSSWEMNRPTRSHARPWPLSTGVCRNRFLTISRRQTAGFVEACSGHLLRARRFAPPFPVRRQPRVRAVGSQGLLRMEMTTPPHRGSPRALCMGYGPASALNRAPSRGAQVSTFVRRNVHSRTDAPLTASRPPVDRVLSRLASQVPHQPCTSSPLSKILRQGPQSTSTSTQRSLPRWISENLFSCHVY
jgi:hypothetical protein